ncbi:MAG: hypothetical protein GY946_30695, partial [bacterium]|nr:hypothetical protein [bacterium]
DQVLGIIAGGAPSLLRSAEGVYRHRSVTPWLPSGWLETVFMLPRFIVWRGLGAGDASGIRLLILIYWFWLAAYAFGGG